MKRIMALVLALMMILTACGTKETPSLADQLPKVEVPVQEEEPAPAPEVDPDTVPEVEEDVEEEDPVEILPVAGTYRCVQEKEEGIVSYVQVRDFESFLLLEYFDVFEGSVFSFWVEECWLDGEPEDNVWYGKSQEFSIMSKGREYWLMPRDRTVTRTEDGLILQYDGFDQEVYVAEAFTEGHTDLQTMKEQLNSFGDLKTSDEPVGQWIFWDGWYTCRMDLNKNGTFLFLSKEPGMPIYLLEGVWGIQAESGNLQLMGEMAGEGRQPFIHDWQWRVEDDGMLYLTEDEHFLLPDYPDGVSFWTWDEYSELPMDQMEALGYTVNWYDMSGEYQDQYGYDYYYSYRIPQLLEVEGDAAVINQEILDMFEPLAEEQLGLLEQKEILDCDLIDYQTYVTEGILTVYVYSISYQENEQHKTWYYDLETGRRTDAKELLRRLGIGEEEFLSKVREAAERYYVETFSGIPEAEREAYGYYERLEWTRSDEAVNLDLPVYVNGMGEICVYGRIGSLAGPDEMWAPLFPFAEWDNWDTPVG